VQNVAAVWAALDRLRWHLRCRPRVCHSSRQRRSGRPPRSRQMSSTCWCQHAASRPRRRWYWCRHGVSEVQCRPLPEVLSCGAELDFTTMGSMPLNSRSLLGTGSARHQPTVPFNRCREATRSRCPCRTRCRVQAAVGSGQERNPGGGDGLGSRAAAVEAEPARRRVPRRWWRLTRK
jgi:hypothetical protein